MKKKKKKKKKKKGNVLKCELLIPLISYIHTSKIMWFHQEKIKLNNF